MILSVLYADFQDDDGNPLLSDVFGDFRDDDANQDLWRCIFVTEKLKKLKIIRKRVGIVQKIIL